MPKYAKGETVKVVSIGGGLPESILGTHQVINSVIWPHYFIGFGWCAGAWNLEKVEEKVEHQLTFDWYEE